MQIDPAWKEQRIRDAFISLVKNFSISATINKIKADPLFVYVTFNLQPDGQSITKYTLTFGNYWFDKSAWEYNKNSFGPDAYIEIENLVPTSLDKDEATMATLRIAAEFFNIFKAKKVLLGARKKI